MTAPKLPQGTVRYAVSAPPQTAKDGRTIRFVLSDSSVGRDGLTLATPGWELDNYRRNPVVLFGHDASNVASVIGRMSNIATEGDQLVGDVEFAPPEVNPMAETVLQMLRGGFLNAGSVGFRALAGRPTSDRNRPGGYDVTRQELMEFSVVPVPALPTALADARRSGVDTAPIFRWAEQIMSMRGETDLPSDAPVVRVDAPSVIPLKLGKRDMYGVACLAMLLSDLGYIQDMTAWEAAFEEDDSPVPQMLTDCLKSLGTALVAMTVEEVTELVNGDGEDDDDALEFAIEVLAAKPEIRKTLIMTLRHIAHGRTVTMTVKEDLVGTIRAGRVLSKANEATLRGAHTQIRAACDDIIGVVNQVEPDDGDDGDRAVRATPAISRERALALVDVLKRK